jgi:hypothetical protein
LFSELFFLALFRPSRKYSMEKMFINNIYTI